MIHPAIAHTKIFFRILVLLFPSRLSTVMKFTILLKQMDLMKRALEQHSIKVRFSDYDRAFLVEAVDTHSRLRRFLQVVKPETLTRKWRKRLLSKWKSSSGNPKKGRPPISATIRNLIIRMKRENPRWGSVRISGVLKSLAIEVSPETVRRTIQRGRKLGEILPTGDWKRFLKSHWDSLFCCDFLTVETSGFRRFYVFFIMELKSRKIVQFGITRNPNFQFVGNQLRGFMFDREGRKTHLIHDNSGELKWYDYESLGIKGIATVPLSPNMNSFAERFVGSLRRECLDHFIIFGYHQLYKLVREYIRYYNEERPHQGVGNCLIEPKNPVNLTGEVKSRPALFGLERSYYRDVA